MENNYIKLPIINHYLYKSNTGMKLLLIPNNDATIISYGMYISVGSLDENDNELGIAHFLEHMMFKGSKKYPDTKLINRLDKLGTTYNASTSYENTEYEIHGLPQYHDELLTILLDMYFNPQIPKESVNIEREIILEEYNMRYDNKFLKLFLNLLKLITKEKNKLYSRPIIGTKYSINKITIDDLNDFRKKYNDHSKTLMTVSGNINVEKTIKHIEDIMNNMISNTSYESIKFNKHENEVIDNINNDDDLYFDTKRRINFNDRIIYEKVPGEQMNVTINFPCWRQFNDKNYYLNILSSILTDGMSGRITKALREKNGMSYSQNSSTTTFNLFGIFTISMGVGINKIYDAIKVVLDELIILYKNGINKDELEKVKNFNLTGMMIHFQKQMSYFNYFTERIANNKKIETLDEIVDKFNSVDINLINEIIRKIINPRQMFISIVGPNKLDKKIIIKLVREFNDNIK